MNGFHCSVHTKVNGTRCRHVKLKWLYEDLKTWFNKSHQLRIAVEKQNVERWICVPKVVLHNDIKVDVVKRCEADVGSFWGETVSENDKLPLQSHSIHTNNTHSTILYLHDNIPVNAGSEGPNIWSDFHVELSCKKCWINLMKCNVLYFVFTRWLIM